MGAAQGCLSKSNVVKADEKIRERESPNAELVNETQIQAQKDSQFAEEVTEGHESQLSQEVQQTNCDFAFAHSAAAAAIEIEEDSVAREEIAPESQETQTQTTADADGSRTNLVKAESTSSDLGFSEDALVEVEGTRVQSSIMSLNSGACQVEIQKPTPFFKGQAVVNGVFKEISLDDYKGKYVVLFFYPLDFTFVCPTEIIAFSDRAEEFRNIGCELIACSTDSHYSHFAWISTTRKNGGLGEMNIPLLADKTGEIARKYGVYKENDGIAFRGLFIIDGKQNLRQITINDLPVGRSVDETLRLVQAFQYTDKHGEVCPAGWKPGGKTIKPNLSESKEYFEKNT